MATPTTTTTTTADQQGGAAPAAAQPVVQRVPNLYGGNIFEAPRVADSIVNELCSFFHRHLVLQRAANLEIEAKLGHLVDRTTDKRLSIGARSRVLFPSMAELRAVQGAPELRFESRVTLKHFQRLNQVLNNRVGHGGATPGGKPVPKVRYARVRETDRFYSAPGGKVRVSVDADGKVLRVVRKSRVSDANIHCPLAPFDLRVTASQETPLAKVPHGPCESVRKKQRLSYRFDVWSFDITTVDTYGQIGPDHEPLKSSSRKTTYEIEVELIEEYTEFARREFEKAGRNEHPNVAVRMVESLLDNLQTLSMLTHESTRLPPLARAPPSPGAAAANPSSSAAGQASVSGSPPVKRQRST